MKRTLKQSIGELARLHNRLSPAARIGLWALLGVEVILITAAERDIQRRPRERIRGPKLLWRIVATQNMLGPAAYFGFGRRHSR